MLIGGGGLDETLEDLDEGRGFVGGNSYNKKKGPKHSKIEGDGV